MHRHAQQLLRQRYYYRLLKGFRLRALGGVSGGGPSADAYLLEDGSSKILLEDGTSLLLME